MPRLLCIHASITDRDKFRTAHATHLLPASVMAKENLSLNTGLRSLQYRIGVLVGMAQELCVLQPSGLPSGAVITLVVTGAVVGRRDSSAFAAAESMPAFWPRSTAGVDEFLIRAVLYQTLGCRSKK